MEDNLWEQIFREEDRRAFDALRAKGREGPGECDRALRECGCYQVVSE
jgi:hypothetical protein